MTPVNDGVCAIHCEVEKRYDEKWSSQESTNKELYSKFNGIDRKMNWILGAVTVAWPLILVIIHLVTKGKP